MTYRDYKWFARLSLFHLQVHVRVWSSERTVLWGQYKLRNPKYTTIFGTNTSCEIQRTDNGVYSGAQKLLRLPTGRFSYKVFLNPVSARQVSKEHVGLVHEHLARALSTTTVGELGHPRRGAEGSEYFRPDEQR